MGGGDEPGVVVTDGPEVGVGSRVDVSCPSCSLPVMGGQQYCSACGASLDVPIAPVAAGSGLGGVRPGDVDYPSENKLAAGLLTVVVPFVSLLVALILRGSQPNPVRRATLRTWAIASGAWLAVGLLIVIIVAASVGNAVSHNVPSTSAPCLGGPDMGSSGVSVGHGKYRFPCADGGSTVVDLGQ
jgi:hypothetical protein